MELTKAILSLRHAASTEKHRTNLAGIYLEPGKAIATSGYVLAQLEMPQSEIKPCLLKTADAAAIDKAIPKRSNQGAVVNVEAANLNGHIPVTIGTTEMKPEKLGETFPDVSQVMPKGEVKYSLTFNADLFRSLVEIVKACDEHGKGRAIVTIECFEDNAANGAMRVTASTAPGLTALLMPCRK